MDWDLTLLVGVSVERVRGLPRRISEGVEKRDRNNTYSPKLEAVGQVK